MPRQTLILDSSQISNYYECPTLWNYSYAQNLIRIDQKDPAKTLRPSDPITMGSLGHKYLELYYSTLATTNNPATATTAALSFNPDSSDTQYPLDTAKRELVKKRFIDYLLFYSTRDFTPLMKKKPSIGIDKAGSLIDTIVEYPLIEQGFSYPLLDTPEYLFVLEGRIDFIGKTLDGTLFFCDHKFQLREHELYRKSIQFRNYSLATNLSLGIINYVRLHDKLGPRTFIRQPLSFSPHESREWKQELTEKFIQIAKSTQKQFFLKNRDACSGKWGNPCPFVSLCEEYNPQIQEAIKKRDYTQKVRWTPW